jgi:hypothetical protein
MDFAFGVSTPISPLCGSVVTNRRPEFAWRSVNGASWYYLWINRDGALHHKQWIEGATNWTPTADLPVGTYRWWVKTWNSDGHGPWSLPSVFEMR